jgi:hypothetical protein
MRIYRERIAGISTSVVRALMAEELIEVESDFVAEVELDVASVLKEYRRVDYELSEKAKDLVASRGLDYSHTRKLKSKLAAEKKFGLGEDAIEWLVKQVVEILLQSRNVEEIYGDDNDLRRVIGPIIKKETGLENEMDREVRRHIKNFEEGTADFDIEYQKTLDRIRSTRGASD